MVRHLIQSRVLLLVLRRLQMFVGMVNIFMFQVQMMVLLPIDMMLLRLRVLRNMIRPVKRLKPLCMAVTSI